jgi:hypothetical protein
MNVLTNKDVGNGGAVGNMRRPEHIGIPYIHVGWPMNVPDHIGIPYIHVGWPMNVPDHIGIPYIHVGWSG